MQMALGDAVTQIPTSVGNVILSDVSCKNIWFSHKGKREVISIDTLRSALASPSPSTTKTKTTEKRTVSPVDFELVYDVMRVHKGSVMFERDHVRRIGESSTTAVQKDNNTTSLSWPVEEIKQTIREYIKNNPIEKEDINIKFVTWFPSYSEMKNQLEYYEMLQKNFAYVLYYVQSFFPPESWYKEGAQLSLLYNAQRHTPNAKIIQQSLRSRAKALQASTNAFEVLLVNDKEEHFLVPEGSRSNYLLLTHDDRLLCSLEKDILIGITLQAVRRAVKAAGFAPIQHESLHVGDLCMAKAIAMLGTSPGVLPVREIRVYYDEKSREEFLSAIRDYEESAGMKEKECVAATKEKILAADGRLELNSAENTILQRLREEYEAEAFR
ncbi:Aminotransferase class IV [Trypanosoma melophagium]|uniref:Aminotransferase class IV n=1 Tax=Trypanosoma melophagium TaxID=715481 RepID=UPI00351A386A|nr:Aminotransferase class IV [Trypanosoma melophagium]